MNSVWEATVALEHTLIEILGEIAGFFWSWPLLIPLVLVGVLYTFGLKGIQFRALPKALKMAFWEQHNPKHQGDISHLQALLTALSATVGTGNIAGVATAVTLGGPGALFWMWMTGLIGMATKYAEAVLGVYYRVTNPTTGERSGGPMYYILGGLGPRFKPLAVVFAFFMMIAAVNIGNMVQSNSLADVMQNSFSNFSISPIATGIILQIIVGLVLIGGIKRIGAVASAIVPFMILLYVGAGSYILILHYSDIPAVFSLIFDDAFSGSAIAGGALGTVIRYGVSRGVFSNESGMGSSPIVAAAAKTDHPCSQALVSMTQTFIDTIIVCTFTGVIIIMSGLWGDQAEGAALTGRAFSSAMGSDVGSLIVFICLAFFAFSTILGWSYYGEKAVVFLFGQKGIPSYRIIFIACIAIGAVTKLELVWILADVTTALMIFPNLIALILLYPRVSELTKDYLTNEKSGKYKIKPFNDS